MLHCVISVIFANQAKKHLPVQNIQAKLPNCNANIYFNQQWMKKGLILNQVKVKVPNMTPVAKFTQKKNKTLKRCW